MIYENIYKALDTQLDYMKDIDPNINLYTIPIKAVLACVSDPAKLEDHHLPCIGYKDGYSAPNDNISRTNTQQGETFIIVLHATINGKPDERLAIRSAKMRENIRRLAKTLRTGVMPDTKINRNGGTLSNDEQDVTYATVQNCRIGPVNNMFKDTLTTRDHLIFDLAFDILHNIS